MINREYRSIYSFLWTVIKPFKWHYAFMFATPIIGSFYDFANNYALKLVIDTFSEQKDITFSSFILPIVLFVGGQIFIDFIWRTSDVIEWRSEPYVRREILERVYNHVQYAPYQYFQNTPSGTTTSKVKGMLDGYDNFWASLHHDFTPRMANTIVLTATLAVVNVKACIFVALWAMVFFTIMYKFSSILDRLSYVTSSHRHDILGLIADNITNIFTVFSFARKKYELARLTDSVNSKFIPANLRVYKVSFWSNVVAAFLYWIMLTTLFLYMIHLRISGQATSGDIVFVMGITLKVAFELWHLIQKMQKFMTDIGDFKAAFSLLQIPKDEQDQNLLEDVAIKKPSIAFLNVSFSYGGQHPVFDKLHFMVSAGEKVGLVGLSGAGKSTLVALLLKNFTLSSGQILIDNQDIAQFSEDSIRKNIAVIPQDIMLFHRSIFDNIRYGRLDASHQEVSAAAQIANIHDFIERLPDKYESLVGERGIKLSGGQRQRIAIARAVLKNAPILILDEATSSLDTKTERLIQKSLQRLLLDSNTTVIAIAHRLSTIQYMDRIIVMDNGKIIDQGSHEELIQTSEFYRSLWEMQRI